MGAHRTVGLVEPLEQEPQPAVLDEPDELGQRADLRLAPGERGPEGDLRAPSAPPGRRGRPGRGSSTRRGRATGSPVDQRLAEGEARRGSASPRRRRRSTRASRRAREPGRRPPGRSVESRSRWSPAGPSTACTLTYADPAAGSSVRNWPSSPRRSEGCHPVTADQNATASSKSSARGVEEDLDPGGARSAHGPILTRRTVARMSDFPPVVPQLLHTVLDAVDVRREAEFWREPPRPRLPPGRRGPRRPRTTPTGWSSPTPTAAAAWRSRRSRRCRGAAGRSPATRRCRHLDTTVPSRQRARRRPRAGARARRRAAPRPHRRPRRAAARLRQPGGPRLLRLRRLRSVMARDDPCLRRPRRRTGPAPAPSG